jgi:hypothetical protein
VTAPQIPPIPPGPLDAPPYPSAPPGESMRVAREAWRHALRGLPMGRYDERLVRAVEDMADQPMLVGLASLLERARRAGEGS